MMNMHICQQSNVPIQYFQVAIDMRDTINIKKLRSYADEDNMQIHLEEKNSYSRPRGSNIYLGSCAEN